MAELDSKIQAALAKVKTLGSIPKPIFNSVEEIEKLLQKLSLPTEISFGLSDRSEPGLSKDILNAAQTIKNVSQNLGIDATRFHSYFDHETSDHEDNNHIISFLPMICEGCIAKFDHDSMIEPLTVLVISWLNKSQVFDSNEGWQTKKYSFLVIEIEDWRITDKIYVAEPGDLMPLDYKTVDLG